MKKIAALFVLTSIIINTNVGAFGAAQGEVIEQPFECFGGGMGIEEDEEIFGAGQDEHYMTADEQFIKYSLLPYFRGESKNLSLEKYFISKISELENPPFDRLNEVQSKILLTQYKKLAEFGGRIL
ncbi:MAG: hypothetical protein RSC41_04900 [Oscillospiraceae bacterium]